jgi:hypothetical protein
MLREFATLRTVHFTKLGRIAQRLDRSAQCLRGRADDEVDDDRWHNVQPQGRTLKSLAISRGASTTLADGSTNFSRRFQQKVS